jgi:hypothetical protein
MKKTNSTKDTLRDEYVSSDFPNGFVRGKYAAKAVTSNIAVLDFSPSPQPSPIKGEGEVDLISTSLKRAPQSAPLTIGDSN